MSGVFPGRRRLSVEENESPVAVSGDRKQPPQRRNVLAFLCTAVTGS